ncbi:MAG TPA: GNAT family protein [Candidatus Limnocylindria bacterium]|nr:GNAT family protein [Candidatus Limnocylindria bacterium]
MATEHVEPPPIELALLRPEDEWLTAALETDPAMMIHLGGPSDPERIPDIHARRLQGIERGDTWYFTIRLGPNGPLVGGVCVWHEAHHPPGTSEAGWGVLPAYQGRGIASAALRELIRLAHEDGRWGDIHAWPSVTNEASNALCRKLGFRHVGVDEFEFRGHQLRCNDWVLPADNA